MQSKNENKINNSLCSRCSKIFVNIFRDEFVSDIRKTYLSCFMLRVPMRACKSEGKKNVDVPAVN